MRPKVFDDDLCLLREVVRVQADELRDRATGLLSVVLRISSLAFSIFQNVW